STDGGFHWENPVALFYTEDSRLAPDKPSVTADPLDPHFVYAIWNNSANGNRGATILSRTTDAGVSWEPARVIYDPSTADSSTLGHIIRVLPDRTLVDVFSESKFSDDGTHKGAVLSFIRSTDTGLTW